MVVHLQHARNHSSVRPAPKHTPALMKTIDLGAYEVIRSTHETLRTDWKFSVNEDIIFSNNALNSTTTFDWFFNVEVQEDFGVMTQGLPYRNRL